MLDELYNSVEVCMSIIVVSMIFNFKDNKRYSFIYLAF